MTSRSFSWPFLAVGLVLVVVTVLGLLSMVHPSRAAVVRTDMWDPVADAWTFGASPPLDFTTHTTARLASPDSPPAELSCEPSSEKSIAAVPAGTICECRSTSGSSQLYLVNDRGESTALRVPSALVPFSRFIVSPPNHVVALSDRGDVAVLDVRTRGWKTAQVNACAAPAGRGSEWIAVREGTVLRLCMFDGDDNLLLDLETMAQRHAANHGEGDLSDARVIGGRLVVTSTSLRVTRDTYVRGALGAVAALIFLVLVVHAQATGRKPRVAGLILAIPGAVVLAIVLFVLLLVLLAGTPPR